MPHLPMREIFSNYRWRWRYFSTGGAESLRTEYRIETCWKVFPLYFNDFPDFVLLPNAPLNGDAWYTFLLSHGFGTLLGSLGVLHHESLKFPGQETLVGQQFHHGIRPADGQVSLKESQIKTGYLSFNFSVRLSMIHSVVFFLLLWRFLGCHITGWTPLLF